MSCLWALSRTRWGDGTGGSTVRPGSDLILHEEQMRLLVLPWGHNSVLAPQLVSGGVGRNQGQCLEPPASTTPLMGRLVLFAQPITALRAPTCRSVWGFDTQRSRGSFHPACSEDCRQINTLALSLFISNVLCEIYAPEEKNKIHPWLWLRCNYFSVQIIIF